MSEEILRSRFILSILLVLVGSPLATGQNYTRTCSLAMHGDLATYDVTYFSMCCQICHDAWDSPACMQPPSACDTPLVEFLRGDVLSLVLDPSQYAEIDDNPYYDYGLPYWGMTFFNTSALLLVDSVIADVTMDSVRPLIRCVSCTFVTLSNVTVRGLQPSPRGASGIFQSGPLHAAYLRRFHCQDVYGSDMFSCVSLDVLPGSVIRIEDSVFKNTSVTYGLSDQADPVEQACHSWGAVVITIRGQGKIAKP